MYAVRATKTVHESNPFRVGEKKYVRARWELEEEITPEHEHAANVGVLVILEGVEGPTDPRLMPFPVVIDEVDTETMVSPDELVTFSEALRKQQAIDKAEIGALQAEVELLKEENEKLTKELEEVKKGLTEVKASVETFPNPANGAAAEPETAPDAAAGQASSK